jgi:predicted outer membrane repeat protein
MHLPCSSERLLDTVYLREIVSHCPSVNLTVPVTSLSGLMLMVLLLIHFARSSLVNLSLASLTLPQSLSLSPMFVHQRAIFRNLRLSRFLTHFYFNSGSAHIQHSKCSFTHFQTSVIYLTSIALRENNFDRKHSNGDGGVFSYSEPNLIIETCLFRSNTATGNGGAFHVSTLVGWIKISNSFFIDNSAHEGGAIYSYCDALQIFDTLFDANCAASSSHLFVIATQLALSHSSFRYAATEQDNISGTLQISVYLDIDSCTFYFNDGPFVITGAATSIAIDSSCFSDGGCFLDFQCEDLEAVSIERCCFNSSREEAISPASVEVDKNTTFGICSACDFSQVTPAPSATLRFGLGEVPVQIVVSVLGIALIVTFVGMFMLKLRCATLDALGDGKEGDIRAQRSSALAQALV